MKIFCVGLNKTATMSIDAVLKKHFKTLHNPNQFTEFALKAIRLNKPVLYFFNPNTDVFSDIFWASNMYAPSSLTCQDWRSDIVKKLYNENIDAKFIINRREIDSWIESREKHVKRNRKNYKYKDKKYRWTKIDKDMWSNEYIDHYSFLQKFFHKKEHLILDICSGDKPKKLFDFLGIKNNLKEFPVINQYK